MEILGLLNQELINVLTTVLPSLDQDWWNSLVLDKLTYPQKTFASSIPPQALERLDLAALLRVADQNWYDISSKGGLNREARNWLKEAQTIHNRWAHAPAGGLPDDICYRDVDTIERLLHAFGADNQTLERIKQEKQRLLTQLAKDNPQVAAPIAPPLASRYQPGEAVRLESVLRNHHWSISSIF